MVVQESLHVETHHGRGTYDITREVQAIVHRSGVSTGLCQIFVRHTSASLVVSENADPIVRHDLEQFMKRLVPDGDPMYDHTSEGPDDMPAHVRAVLTNVDLSVPVSDGRLALGTWQGIYLWEHRIHGHRRTVTVTVLG
jgi:secondary thiamine-phosphate synthase enzyme